MAHKKLSISLPREIAEELAKEAETSGVTKSRIIQAALDEYFEWLAKIEAARRKHPEWADMTDSEVDYEMRRQMRSSETQSSGASGQDLEYTVGGQ